VKLTDEFDAAIKELDDELTLLDAADKVAGMFKAYYEDVQNEMLTMIKTDKYEGCDEECDCKNDCAINTPKVETAVTETIPQTVADLTSLLKKIFGDNGIYQL
jgi:hypothetical protein